MRGNSGVKSEGVKSAMIHRSTDERWASALLFFVLRGRPGTKRSGAVYVFIGSHAEYVKLFGSEDFIEGRKAEGENRPPIFHGR
jgi:hypothetical protein